VPREVVLDPAATLDTPDWLLYATGIRAVDHADESYCRRWPTRDRGELAAGLRLLHRSLPQIQADPRALRPRLDAQFDVAGDHRARRAGPARATAGRARRHVHVPHGHRRA
jgi:maleylacetate reductase